MSEFTKGILLALGAFTIWGLIPLYWSPLKSFDSFELLFHRAFWLVVVNLIFLIITKKLNGLWALLKDFKSLKVLMLTGFLIGSNWVIFIWGVSHHQVKEVSLGYFINPLLNVFLGALILKEKLKPLVWICVGIAFLAVFYLIFSEKIIPWVSLTLALTFGFYGLLKKKLKVSPLLGLTIEGFTILVLMLSWVIYSKSYLNYQLHHMHGGWMLYMSFAGILTLMPLLFFNMSAQVIPLSTLGFVQYLAPSLQFLVAFFVFNEEMNSNYLFSFILIWMALVIFSGETIRKKKPV